MKIDNTTIGSPLLLLRLLLLHLLLLSGLDTVTTPSVPSMSTTLSPEQRKAVQQGFLSHFGMSSIPSPSNKSQIPVPDYMWKIYEDAEKELIDSNWIRHYYPKELFELNSGLELSYNLAVSVHNESVEAVRKATLKLRLKGNGRVNVYEIDELNNQIHRLLDSKLVENGTDSEWTDMDVTSALMRRRRERDKLLLHISFSDSLSLSSSPVHSPSSASLTQKESAALIVYVHHKDDGRKRRRKRENTQNVTDRPRKGKGRKKGRKGHNRQHSQKKLCQRVDLHVDFKELNWDDWILSPLGYNAYMCVGECINPMPSHLNSTNHAIVQSLLNSLNPSVPAPCCVPTEMSSLHILYRDIENKIVMKNYPDMKVEACGCR